MIKWLFVTLLKLLLPFLRPALMACFRVRVKGREQLDFTEKTVLISNHVSLLDAVLLALILPKEVAFVVNTKIAKRFAWLLLFREHIAVNPLNPYSVRTMLRTVQSGTTLVVFPEGRITTTGGMMKVYGGIGYIALRSQAQMLPIAINGLEYSKLSYLRGKLKQIWFPAVSITFGAAFQVPMSEQSSRRLQKERATEIIRSHMQNHLMESRMKPELNLFNELLIAAKQHGSSTIICEDIVGDTTLTYRKLLLTTYTMAGRLKQLLEGQNRAAVLLPNTAANVVTLFSLFRLGVTPAILNYTAGKQTMVAKMTNEASYKKILNRIGLGKLSYFLSILRVFTTYQPYTAWLEIDGTIHELPDMWLAAVANIPFYGGSIQICPAASPHDGVADVVVIQSRGRFRLLPILFTVYQGKHIHHPAVSFYKGKSISLRTFHPLLVQADGEFAGSTPLQIEIIPSAITVIGSAIHPAEPNA